MWILFFIIVFIIIYVKSFKDNFTAETVDKVSGALLVIAIIILLLGILSSILG